MTVLFATLFVLSIIVNVVLAWYINKLVNNLKNGIKGVDELQELLEQYSSFMEEVGKLDQYYGDDTINAAVKNTKVIIEACKYYKNSVLDIEEEATTIENQNG
jgi:predicted PurR-regulated permease PerM